MQPVDLILRREKGNAVFLQENLPLSLPFRLDMPEAPYFQLDLEMRDAKQK